MTLSIRKGWSVRLWRFLNRHMRPSCNVVVWILTTVIITVVVQEVLGLFSLSIELVKLVNGLLLGISLGFMPNSVMETRYRNH